MVSHTEIYGSLRLEYQREIHVEYYELPSPCVIIVHMLWGIVFLAVATGDSILVVF